jgi:hypothetical protein
MPMGCGKERAVDLTNKTIRELLDKYAELSESWGFTSDEGLARVEAEIRRRTAQDSDAGFHHPRHGIIRLNGPEAAIRWAGSALTQALLADAVNGVTQ